MNGQLLDTSILNSITYPEINSSTIEEAAKAPLSKLYGTWYTTNGNIYLILNADGTGSMNTLHDQYNGIRIVWQQNLQWKKENGLFRIRFVGEAKFTLAENDQPIYEKLTRSEKDNLLKFLTSLVPRTRESNPINDKILYLGSDFLVVEEQSGTLRLVNKKYITKLEQEAKLRAAEEKDTKIYEASQLEVPAYFPREQERSDIMNSWIQNKINKLNYIPFNQGTVWVKFVIEKDGKLSNIVVEKSTNKEFNELALNIVKEMPEFTAGKLHGYNKRSTRTVEISFPQILRGNDQISINKTEEVLTNFLNSENVKFEVSSGIITIFLDSDKTAILNLKEGTIELPRGKVIFTSIVDKSDYFTFILSKNNSTNISQIGLDGRVLLVGLREKGDFKVEEYKLRKKDSSDRPYNKKEVSQEEINLDDVVTNPEKSPEFPGGNAILKRFISSSIRYPEEALNNGEEAIILVKCVVEKNGDITCPSIVNGGNTVFEEEAIRVVRRLPKWLPAKDKGETVRSFVEIEVPFKINN